MSIAIHGDWFQVHKVIYPTLSAFQDYGIHICLKANGNWTTDCQDMQLDLFFELSLVD